MLSTSGAASTECWLPGHLCFGKSGPNCSTIIQNNYSKNLIYKHLEKYKDTNSCDKGKPKNNINQQELLGNYWSNVVEVSSKHIWQNIEYVMAIFPRSFWQFPPMNSIHIMCAWASHLMHLVSCCSSPGLARGSMRLHLSKPEREREREKKKKKKKNAKTLGTFHPP